jgi:hypothetical protein
VARLSDSLPHYGIDTDPKMFVDQLNDMFHGLYPSFTLDDLLCRPREALAFCDAVRRGLGNYDLPDDLILRPMLNERKRG